MGINGEEKSHLAQQLGGFFSKLTDNPHILDLVADIQQHIEKGHTAIFYKPRIDDPLISDDGESGYLVHRHGLAGFRRHFRAESAIKQFFDDPKSLNIDPHVLKGAIQKVCQIIGHQASQASASMDRQWQACLGSLFRKGFILTGGPGTGKTSTVIRVMLLYQLINPNKKIAMAAPTGKAANRMMQSIGQAVASFDLDEALTSALMQPAQTIHRLLGYRHHSNQFSFNHSTPLPYDFVIIDEASMMDVSMMSALIKALKPSAQLLLMGDKNQLPAVEAGQVFADLCSLLQTPQACDLFKHYLGSNQNDRIAHPVFVELTKNYRFDAQSVIAKACEFLINQDVEGFMALKKHQSFHWLNPQRIDEKLSLLRCWYENVPEGESAIVLSAVNHGDNSVNELNDLSTSIHQHDYQKSHHHSRGYYEGMPIMVTKNDYVLGIFNGDISNLTKKAGRWFAPFVIEGESRLIQLDAINQWSVAHAISIHKSQGSEYDHVLITIPDDEDLDMLNTALLFTAISRAKKTIQLWCSERIVKKIIETPQTRVTFLKYLKKKVDESGANKHNAHSFEGL